MSTKQPDLFTNTDIRRVQEALQNPRIRCIALISPTVRVVWGEGLGLPREVANTGRLVSALHKVGFDFVYNTASQASASVRLMAQELRERLKLCTPEATPAPLFSANCPEWVRLLEEEYPELSGFLSAAGSPSKSLTAEIRSRLESLPESAHLTSDGEQITTTLCVTVTGCHAKKPRPGSPLSDNITLMTIELIELFRESGLDFSALSEEAFDEPYADDAGWGLLVSAPGGVAEAVVHELAPAHSALYVPVLHSDNPIKECSISIEGRTLQLAAVNGMQNVEDMLARLKSGDCEYDFIEFMTCDGSCVNGLGQPPATDNNKAHEVTTRADALRALADITRWNWGK